MEYETETGVTVEVIYALPDKATVKSLKVSPTTTVLEAIEQSGLQQQFPEIDLQKNRVGIYGTRCDLQRILEDGDRVEIYRPLLIDPKEARRRRAEKKKY